MKHINNYNDYIREHKQYINDKNLEPMNEGIKHWLATFLMLVNLGVVPPAIMASDNETKKEFVDNKETIEMVANKFKSYYDKNSFYNNSEYAWEDFQKVYGESTYDLSEIVTKASIGDEVNENVPQPTNYVNDYAELIYPQEHEDSINNILSDYEKQSGMEIAVITFNSLQDKNYMSSVSQYVFSKWGVGKAGADNGILIVIDEKDKHWRIQTGYGAEIVLTDLMCKRLGESLLVPSFKAGDYEGGIKTLIDGIIKEIGTNSEDIKKFQDDYKKAKAEKAQKIKDGFITVSIIVSLLALMIWLISIIISKANEKKKLKERSKELLTDMDIIIKKLEKELEKSEDLEYLKQIKNEYDKYINNVEGLPDKETSNQELINKLFQYNKQLGQFLIRADKFNRYYKSALNTDSYTDDAKRYIQLIRDVEKSLSVYGITSHNRLDEKDIDTASDKIKKNIGNADLFRSLDNLKNSLTSIKSSFREIKSRQAEIPFMKNVLSEYKKHVKEWKSKLSQYGLSKYDDNVDKMVYKLEGMLKLPESDLLKKYKMYIDILKYVEGLIDDEQGRRRRKQEEEERKRRKKEEEERRRRNLYSSSSSNSSFGGFGGNSSSFGGFGGGMSGGGGAGGDW